LTSPSEYYEENLYPLQDGVLNTLSKCNARFYLTGGTALSRAYYHHRYSDDLDFFTSDNDDYADEVKMVFRMLREAGFLWNDDTDVRRALTYNSVILRRSGSDAYLKLDFVNDLVPHFGEIISTPLYHRIDPVRNILSNKLGAIFRFAAKDIADVREITRHEDFLWSDIVSEARAKDSGVETEIIAEIIGGFPKSEFEKIKWREPAPSWERFSADIQIIVDDMVNCRENSLCMPGERASGGHWSTGQLGMV
jgi:hypothetical protein